MFSKEPSNGYGSVEYLHRIFDGEKRNMNDKYVLLCGGMSISLRIHAVLGGIPFFKVSVYLSIRLERYENN